MKPCRAGIQHQAAAATVQSQRGNTHLPSPPWGNYSSLSLLFIFYPSILYSPSQKHTRTCISPWGWMVKGGVAWARVENLYSTEAFSSSHLISQFLTSFIYTFLFITKPQCLTITTQPPSVQQTCDQLLISRYGV